MWSKRRKEEYEEGVEGEGEGEGGLGEGEMSKPKRNVSESTLNYIYLAW